MTRIPALMAISLAIIGCSERDKTSSTTKESEVSKFGPVERAETGNATRRERRSPEKNQRTSDTGSVDDLLANCERLRRGDGTGAVNITNLIEAYKKLAMVDPKLALEQFGDPRIFAAIGPALNGAAEIVAARDPELLVTWLNEGLSKFEDRNKAVPLISITLNHLAAVSPDKALAAFKNLDIPADKRTAVISALFKGLGGNDPSAAIKMAGSLDPSLKSSALAGAVEGAVKNDPRLANAIASEIPDPDSRQRAVDGVFAEWFMKDAKMASVELLKMDHKIVEDMLVSGALDSRSSVYSMSRSDPLTLLSLLDEIYPTSVNRTLFEKSITEIVKTQPERTFATISRMPEGEMKVSLYKDAYATLARADSGRAVSMFALEDDPAIRAATLPKIASSVGTGGMEAAMHFLDSLNSSEEKSIAFASAFNAIVHSDLDSAANYLVDRDKQTIDLPPQEKERGCSVVAFRLASADLDQAQNWMAKLPQEEQPYAMTGIASQMAQRDVKALGEYLNSIERNQVWAAGVRVLISTVESGDADTANKWRQILKETNLKKP